jgi:hypothetical protein
MKPIPISVWLSAIVLFIYSANFARHNPEAFFESLLFTVIFVAFARIIYWFVEEKE